MVTAALFGLLGVVVGGVLNGLVAWRLELKRRERAARAGARLVIAELRELARAYFWAESVNWRGVGQLPSGEWEQHRALLAEALTSAQFKTVSAVYAEIVTWRASMADPQPMTDSLRETVGKAAEDAEEAMLALKPLSLDPSPWWRRSRDPNPRHLP